MKVIIGIDPGVTGAMAVVRNGRIEMTLDLPCAKTDGFNGINPNLLDRLIHGHVGDEIAQKNVVAYCEKSIMGPGNGKMTMRSVYDCRGVIRSVLALSQVPLIYVPPQTWKKSCGIPPKSDKEYSRGLALQRFPELTQYLMRKKDHNRAERL